jgi:hypothetical protein
MLELIPLIKGEEQTFSLAFKGRDFTCGLRFSDYGKYWFVDIQSESTDELGDTVRTPYFMGLKLPIDTNPLKCYEYLELGGLALIDTDPDSPFELDTKQDLGDRLKLYRST